MNLTIGSGDIPNLLMGLNTKGYRDLWRKFLDENPPYYNSFASPIDALRTGAILENRYFQRLSDDWVTQVKMTYEKMNVFTCSIDFGRRDKGEIVEFQEVKTIWLTDYFEVISPIVELEETKQIAVLKKKFKNNYNQIQDQLMCSGLDSAWLTFVAVTSYDDDTNKSREIEDNEVTKFKITRDDEVIEMIQNRGHIFQDVKDHFNL